MKTLRALFSCDMGSCANLMSYMLSLDIDAGIEYEPHILHAFFVLVWVLCMNPIPKLFSFMLAWVSSTNPMPILKLLAYLFDFMYRVDVHLLYFMLDIQMWYC